MSDTRLFDRPEHVEIYDRDWTECSVALPFERPTGAPAILVDTSVLREAIQAFSQKLAEQKSVLGLAHEVKSLAHRVQALESSSVAYICTFAPEQYVVERDIPVCFRPSASGFVASFLDANIASEGDTIGDAFENLKALLLDYYEDLSSEPDERLGPEPLRQKKVLMALIKPMEPRS